MTRDEIRAIFMDHGFTIKEGQNDLKQYVYDAAYALLDRIKNQEPVAWHIGNPDGTMNRLGYIYQRLSSAQAHIEIYEGELDAVIVPLYLGH